MMKLAIIFLIVIAVVCIWRGIWGLLDIYLLPNDPTLSLSLSILLGLGLIALVGKKFIFLL